MSLRIDQLAVLNLVTVGNSVTAGSFVRSGGTAVQFLMADGSVSTNPGWLTSITSNQVTTALGYTPYNATNPNGYTSNTGTVTSVSGTGTVSGLTLSGTVTSSGSLTLGGTLTLTSGQVTGALGYTPYNSSNPNGYITSSGSISGSAGSVAWTNVTGRPSALSSFTNDIVARTTLSASGDFQFGGQDLAQNNFSLSGATTDTDQFGRYYYSGTSGSIWSRYLPVDKTGRYRMRLRWKATASNSTYLAVILLDTNGNNINGAGTYWAYPWSGSGAPTSWTTSEYWYDGSSFPSNAAYVAFGISHTNYGGGSATYYVSQLELERYNDKIAGNTVWHAGNLTNLNQLSNGPGYITGYTETDTLATVTGRGASTSTNSIFTGGLQARRNQSDNNYTTAALWTESYGGTTTGIAFHISGNVGKFLEMRTNGVLYWENGQVWTSSNLTNLNQLSNGPGYITSSGSITGNAATATYATNATRLYASDGSYVYGGAAPYYMTMTYDGSRWLLQVTPGTPAAVRVSYADSAGSASSASTSSQVTINYNNDSNSTYQLLWGSGNSVYGTAQVYVNPSSDVIYARGGYISPGNPWNTSDSAYFPNGITTAGGTNWVYGLTYLGNAPGNGSGVEVASNGRIYVRANSAAASHGFSGLFVDRNSASSNFIPWSFENEYGNHSWGIVARFRISQSGADRPSIQFSSASSDTRWNLGYNTGSDDNFRITQNMGYRNDNSTSDGWGTERFRINTDGNTLIFASLGIGGITPDVRLSVNGDAHVANIVYLGGTAGSVGSWGTRTYGYGGDWTNNSRTVRFDNVGYGTSWSFTIDTGGNVTSSATISSQNVYATAAIGRVSAGSTSIDGMLFDSSRSALIARGNYPHIELWSDVSNSNHGGTLRFGGYDNGSSGAYKSWNIGAPGSDLYFLDIAYGGASNSNPHAGIAGLGAAYSYPGAFNMMRFHNNGNIGIGNFGTYGSEGNTPGYKLDVRGNGRYTGLLYLDAAESMNLYGIRGRFTNEFIHLYQKVGVGHPGGWGQGEGNTPTQGLSTYGGITIAYGTGGTSTFHGHLRVTGNNNLYLDSNFGQSIVGLYSASRYQGVFAMGDAYKLSIDGTSPGNLYGLAWSHPNTGGVAGNLNTHGLLVLENGGFLAAISGSIRARDDMRAPYFYGSGSIRCGDMWGGAGLYRPSGSMVFGIENSDWIFSKGAVTQAYFAGGDGNLWMRWAGDWLSNLLGAKASTGHLHDDRYFFDYGFTEGYPGPNANTFPSNRSAFTYANNAPLSGCIAHFGASGYGIQLNGDYQGDSFSMRSRNGDNATWRPWKRLLTDYNYNNYSPTLTGGNASGTWGISITGSAGSASSATFLNSSNYINRCGSSGNANTDFQNTPAGSVRHNGDDANLSNSPGGTWWFYDNYRHSNGSNFWGTQVAWGWEDNANRLATRNISGGNFGGWVYYLNSSNFSNWAVPIGGAYLDNIFYFRTNLGGYCGSLSNARMQAYSDSNNSAFISFHKSGQYAVNMGLDADNVMRIGGWSAAANRWQLDMSGNMTVAGDVTAYSDARVKENVVTVEDALDRVQKMRGVFYNRTDSDDKKRKVGVIAQEIMEVLPEVVNQDNAGMYNVSYGNVVGVLIEAIKEQQSQIEDLKNQITELKENK